MFLIAMHHGIQLTPNELPSIEGSDMLPAVLRALRKVGLKSKALHNCRWEKASALGTAYPALAIRKDGSWLILVHAITAADGTQRAAIVDPCAEQNGIQFWTPETFVDGWDGALVLCKRVQRPDDEGQPFGLRWFLPEIVAPAPVPARRRGGGDAVQLIGFAIPLLFQVLIDKVMTHPVVPDALCRGAAVFVLLAVFDGFFGYTRQRLMLLATNKIDARLARAPSPPARVCRFLLRRRTTAGVLARHMQQTEKLRHFLTGRLFQTMLDAARCRCCWCCCCSTAAS